ncbi:hypothetical protein GOBAR_AA16729 [Gossypium barbadense]|uniref:Uncharacterized protein n=1 Tax=Gossypium barbadense TaxID=3634 RepID=A0A2P5XKR4_GOSBA|nr:hypothetical protein GOBAR_AA16729 [Gossypium barbadense]
MSPQGISSMLSMRMIERRRGTYPPQYRLTQSTEEEAYEDIPDDEGERALASSTLTTPTSYGVCRTGTSSTLPISSSLRFSSRRSSMSPQGISSMLSMRMIERRRGTYPPQYRLTQSTEEEAYEDIPDDVPS